MKKSHCWHLVQGSCPQQGGLLLVEFVLHTDPFLFAELYVLKLFEPTRELSPRYMALTEPGTCQTKAAGSKTGECNDKGEHTKPPVLHPPPRLHES